MKRVQFISTNGSEPTTTYAGPLKVLTNDGLYFVKFFDSFVYGKPSERYKELINEYICFELASVLELPIPEAAIVEVSNGIGGEYIKDGEKVIIKPSLNFGSKNIDGIITDYSGPEDIRKCSNQQDLLPVMVFDAWIHNKDRDLNYSNMLFERIKLNFYIIDHGNVFGSGNLWNFGCLPNDQNGKIVVDTFEIGGIYNSIIESINLKDYINDTKRRFSKLNADIISSIINSVPREWFLSSEDATALLDYLVGRLAHINDYITLVLNRGGEL